MWEIDGEVVLAAQLWADLHPVVYIDLCIDLDRDTCTLPMLARECRTDLLYSWLFLEDVLNLSYISA